MPWNGISRAHYWLLRPSDFDFNCNGFLRSQRHFPFHPMVYVLEIFLSSVGLAVLCCVGLLGIRRLSETVGQWWKLTREDLHQVEIFMEYLMWDISGNLIYTMMQLCATTRGNNLRLNWSRKWDRLDWTIEKWDWYWLFAKCPTISGLRHSQQVIIKRMWRKGSAISLTKCCTSNGNWSGLVTQGYAKSSDQFVIADGVRRELTCLSVPPPPPSKFHLFLLATTISWRPLPSLWPYIATMVFIVNSINIIAYRSLGMTFPFTCCGSLSPIDRGEGEDA